MCCGHSGAADELAPTLAATATAAVADSDEAPRWPPAREELHLTQIELLSLHWVPKRGERRPRLHEGRRGGCHQYEPQLSGSGALPPDHEPSAPELSVALHPIGGFCAVAGELPLPAKPQTRYTAPVGAMAGAGLHARVGQTAHCLAAEPHATFLKLSLHDDERGEVAFETCVLGRLRPGYRVFRLRDATLGTRIELCVVLVRISTGSVPHVWATPREMRQRERLLKEALGDKSQQLDALRAAARSTRSTLARSTPSATGSPRGMRGPSGVRDTKGAHGVSSASGACWPSSCDSLTTAEESAPSHATPRPRATPRCGQPPFQQGL